MVALGLAGVVIVVAAYAGRLLASGIIHGAGLLAASVRDGRRLEPAHGMPAPALRVVQTYPTPAFRQQWRSEGMRPAA